MGVQKWEIGERILHFAGERILIRGLRRENKELDRKRNGNIRFTEG